MQIAPSELKKLSLWEFAAMVEGWNKANAPAEKTGELTTEEEDELFEFIQETPPVWVN